MRIKMRRKGGGQLITKHTSIQYINPTDVDGPDMYELVKSSTLDSNSPYCYIMMSKFFKKTCIVAKAKETLAGFVTGFVQPDRQDTVFVWQIGVDQRYRKQGIATKMLKALIESEGCQHVSYIEATVTPSNYASKSLFTGFAEKMNTNYTVHRCFPKEWFPDDSHEQELLYRIGPIKK
jgi:L-2,4-diaminobutyric acid acetyltransferase